MEGDTVDRLELVRPARIDSRVAIEGRQMGTPDHAQDDLSLYRLSLTE